MTDLERIDKKIEEQKARVKLAEARVEHKDHYGKAEWDELSRLKTERELILTEVKWDHHGAGLVLIEDKFIYALKSGKWKVKGKPAWYRSKSIEHFVSNYVRKTND